KVSNQLYQILGTVDAHFELGAWYGIDESIYSLNYYKKTGKTDHFFLSEDELVAQIKKACEDFLRKTNSNLGELLETSFEQAEDLFRNFLKDNNVSDDLVWIFSEDVISDGMNFEIRTPLPPNNRELAKRCFELGKQRNLGIAFHVFCSLSGRSCSYIELPENDLDAEYRLMGNRYIKFSFRNHIP